MTDTATDRPHEDRVLPAVVYGLYVFSIPSVWVAVLLGLVLAYANREHAGPRMASHYQFLIQTFWKSIWWAVIGVALCIVGGIFAVVLVGIPFLIAGVLILTAVHIWFYIRLAVGVIYLVQDQPHPRPDAWLF